MHSTPPTEVLTDSISQIYSLGEGRNVSSANAVSVIQCESGC